jgi:hypothetical protein
LRLLSNYFDDTSDCFDYISDCFNYIYDFFLVAGATALRTSDYYDYFPVAGATALRSPARHLLLIGYIKTRSTSNVE